MKVRIEHDFVSRGVKVYAYERLTETGARVLRMTGPDEWEYEDVAVGARPSAPSFTLPLDLLEALVAEAHEILPPSAATDRHLTDAIAVRDRLLTVVEGRES